MIFILPVFAIGYLAYSTYKKRSAGKGAKRSMLINLCIFACILAFTCVLTLGASAEESKEPETDAASEAAAAADNTDSSKGLGLIAAGLVTGLAGIGGGIAVAAGAPAAIAATSEDPKVFGKALIFVALGETIALYGVVISILILNKI